MDFGLLPDEIWVEIMSYLSMSERYKLSKTCQKLYAVFSCPGVWKKCSVILRMPFERAPFLNEDEICRPLQLHQYLKLLEHFGAHVKDLTLQIQGNLSTIEHNQVTILNSLADKCKNLKKLSISFDYKNIISGQSSNNICAIRTLIKESSHSLKVLNMDSWIISENTQETIPLDCLPQNLERLSIFHPRLTMNMWIKPNAITPSYSEVINGIQHLRFLTVLSLHCQSISSELLEELTKATRSGQPFYPHLQRLGILATGNESSFYTISLTTWKKFSSRTPKILVDLSIGNTINHERLLFLSTVSLHSITFAQYARYCPSLLYKFNTSELTSFVDYSEGCGELSDLIHFITSCPKLDRLVYNGNILTTTVVQLAQMKNRKWREFRINLDNVLLKPCLLEGINLTDDDVVVKNNTTGEVVQVELFLRPEKGFFATDDQESLRRSQLEEMENEVKRCLSCHWQPIRKTKFLL